MTYLDEDGPGPVFSWSDWEKTKFAGALTRISHINDVWYIYPTMPLTALSRQDKDGD